MAGDRHHILPRFIMKGFASRLDAKPVFTWLYRKGAEPREVSTRDIAVGRLFYESPEGSADSELTEAEVAYSATVDCLRTASNGSFVPPVDAGELVAHLLTRTKHLRDSFEEMGDFAIARFDEFLSRPDALEQMIQSSPGLQEEVIVKVLSTLPPELHPNARRTLQVALPHLLPKFIEEAGPAFAKEAGDAMKAVRMKVPELVKVSHVKALQKSTAPEERVEIYSRLQWSVQDSCVPLGLGDVAALFEVEGSRRFKPIDEKGDQLVGVYLPVTTTRLLIGRPEGHQGDLEIPQIRDAYIKACREFFISGVLNQDLRDLQASLGTDSEILSRAEMEAIFLEMLPQ